MAKPKDIRQIKVLSTKEVVCGYMLQRLSEDADNSSKQVMQYYADKFDCWTLDHLVKLKANVEDYLKAFDFLLKQEKLQVDKVPKDLDLMTMSEIRQLLNKHATVTTVTKLKLNVTWCEVTALLEYVIRVALEILNFGKINESVMVLQWFVEFMTGLPILETSDGWRGVASVLLRLPNYTRSFDEEEIGSSGGPKRISGKHVSSTSLNIQLAADKSRSAKTRDSKRATSKVTSRDRIDEHPSQKSVSRSSSQSSSSKFVSLSDESFPEAPISKTPPTRRLRSSSNKGDANLEPPKTTSKKRSFEDIKKGSSRKSRLP